MAPPEGGRGRLAPLDDRRRAAVVDRRTEAASGKVGQLLLSFAHFILNLDLINN